MGVGRNFSRGGAVRDFPKSGGIWFLPVEIEKTTFFANNFKIQGRAMAPLAPPLPTPIVEAHILPTTHLIKQVQRVTSFMV